MAHTICGKRNPAGPRNIDPGRFVRFHVILMVIFIGKVITDDGRGEWISTR